MTKRKQKKVKPQEQHPASDAKQPKTNGPQDQGRKAGRNQNSSAGKFRSRPKTVGKTYWRH